MRSRTTAAGIACLLALSVVGGASTPAGARSAAPGAAVAPGTRLIACAAGSLPLAAGHAVHVSVSLDATHAVLRGTSGKSYLGTPRVLRPRLVVTSSAGGVSTFRPRPVAETPGHGVLVMGVQTSGPQRHALCLARFDRGPVAVLGTTNAFNQCCFLLDTFAQGLRARGRLQDGLVMPRLRVLNGAPAIVTGDGGFLARFTDYADSAAPLRVLGVGAHRQLDVTGQHRAMLRQEATRLWNRYDGDHAHGLGYLAAWAADQDRLGNDAHVWSTIGYLAAAGDLHGLAGWPRNHAFVKALRSYLAEAGYR